MQIYNYPVKEPEMMTVEHAHALVPDGCFLKLHQSPDLTVTQGVDLEIKFCGEVSTRDRPMIACIGPDYVTVDEKSCAAVGDLIELTCLDGCDAVSLGQETRQKINGISADGLKLTLSPGFPSVTVERCYRNPDLLEGCLDLSPDNVAPRFTILVDNWQLHGIAAHRISNGCVKSMGMTVAAGSAIVRTALVGSVQPKDHVSIPSAGISDAVVKSVRTVTHDGLLIDVLELSQASKASGCFPGMVADGLLIAFEIENDGPCSIARIPASKTAKLTPPFGVEVPAEADPMTFLGHYLFVAQSVVIDKAGIPQVRTQAIDSGLLVLKSTVASSNMLNP